MAPNYMCERSSKTFARTLVWHAELGAAEKGEGTCSSRTAIAEASREQTIRSPADSDGGAGDV
eukprot:6617607-Pyramimonas_sp.AAC.1